MDDGGRVELLMEDMESLREKAPFACEHFGREDLRMCAQW